MIITSNIARVISRQIISSSDNVARNLYFDLWRISRSWRGNRVLPFPARSFFCRDEKPLFRSGARSLIGDCHSIRLSFERPSQSLALSFPDALLAVEPSDERIYTAYIPLQPPSWRTLRALPSRRSRTCSPASNSWQSRRRRRRRSRSGHRAETAS